MRVEVLASVVNQDPAELPKRMGIEGDALIINQTDHFGYEEHTIETGGRTGTIRCFSFAERGVGLSRNAALMRARGDILLFSDEDIVYDSGYDEKVLAAFTKHPEADFLLFNMRVGQARATYHTERFHRVRIWNAGRYPTYSFAVRRDKLIPSNVTFSLLFGGGAAYSAGEDSLFLKDCLKYGLKVYAIDVEIGEEKERPSTWFQGYTEKFFFDRGALYHFLYRGLAGVMAFRFLLAHHKTMCGEIPPAKALGIMRKGIRSVKGL